MKKIFPEFNKYSDGELKDIFGKCTFIFDTNVLLNLYKYSPETKNELLEILDKVKDRIWMPYQVGLEYNFNRLSVIRAQEKIYKDMIKDIENDANKFTNSLGSKYNKKHPSIKWAEIKGRLDSCINDLISELKEKEVNHPNWFTNDEVLTKLNELFEGKVGEKYEQDKLDEIFKEGEGRYENEVPPGYKDKTEKSGVTKEYDGLVYKDEYGDLVMWYQIIDYAIESKKTIIFITDDTKEDWWKDIKGKTVGPRIELLNEMKMKASVPFYMYRTDSFMKKIRTHLNEAVNDAAIQEVKELREDDRNNKVDWEEYLTSPLDNAALEEYRKQIQAFMWENYNKNIQSETKSKKIFFPKNILKPKQQLVTEEHDEDDLDSFEIYENESSELTKRFMRIDELNSLLGEIGELATDEYEEFAKEKIQAILSSSKNNSTRIDKLKDFKNSLIYLQAVGIKPGRN
ncbi:PIN-like domain-containing protein [Bacillus cereus]|uniref:PIN-like domain-containing protein n=1 Tax=Bacillus cereus TaxID=1396 RepID=UPI0014445A60|nr:PIN domain-containing protein [Bacillus cereus]NKW85485.1 DUF4935 domain-containing protein [Bacillus cereus]